MIGMLIWGFILRNMIELSCTNITLNRDAGLVLSAFLDSCGHSAEPNPRLPRLQYIQRVLSKEKLGVLELGAGCGIAGITVARRFSNAKVILTDLPEAEEIARYNITMAAAQTGGEPSFAKIEYQNLDWGKPLP